MPRNNKKTDKKKGNDKPINKTVNLFDLLQDNSDDGGDDTTPVWLAFVPGTDGIRFCDAGTIAGTYPLTLAGTGDTKVAPEVWVTK